MIDTSLAPGSLTYAECKISGELDDEFLIFTHICHPALANDNASGLAVATLLAAELSQARPRLSYRFVFAPATIGSITWLARNVKAARALRGGLVVGLLGDPGPLTYKRSRRGNAEIDFIAASAVQALDRSARVIDFSPYGYDERQFCSPGLNLPVGRLTRSPNGEYPEYHTSADNPDLMSVDALANSVHTIARIIDRVDGNHRLRRTHPNCEPRLGKHGLFRNTGGSAPKEFEYAMLWLLNQADGTHGPNDVADAARLPDSIIGAGVAALLSAGLIEEIDQPGQAPKPTVAEIDD
jgi:aminopeptidase-like protein